MLHLPEYVVPVCMLVLGYPAEDHFKRQKPLRCKLEDIVCVDQYHRKDKQELKNMFEHKAGNKTLNEWATAFCNRKYNSDFYLRTPNDIPIYVPVGTAEKYRNAWGWDYFTNFIETDDFPTSIHNITTEHYDSKNCVYDLMGRKVINPHKGQVYIKNGKKILFAY